jgi:hypothetical protein
VPQDKLQENSRVESPNAQWGGRHDLSFRSHFWCSSILESISQDSNSRPQLQMGWRLHTLSDEIYREKLNRSTFFNFILSHGYSLFHEPVNNLCSKSTKLKGFVFFTTHSKYPPRCRWIAATFRTFTEVNYYSNHNLKKYKCKCCTLTLIAPP